MSYDPFIGEIKIFGFNFAPQNYFSCSGQILSIRQYTAFFPYLEQRMEAMESILLHCQI